jgi:hypothetical protein
MASNQEPKFKVGDAVYRVEDTNWGIQMRVTKGNTYIVKRIAKNGNIELKGRKDNYEQKYFIKATKLHKALL